MNNLSVNNNYKMSARIVQKGTLKVTPEKGMIDNRPTCSLIQIKKRRLFSTECWNVLVDLDHPKKNPNDILNSLASVNLEPEDIDVVILTHLHPDHIGHKDLFPCANFVFHCDERISFYFNDNKTIRLEGSAIWKITEDLPPEPVDYTPDLRMLENSLYLRHCPGHTKGSLVIFALIDNLVYAFCGGTFLNRKYFDNFEPPKMSWKEDKIYEHMSFIRDNADIVVPGHGMPFKI